MATLNDSYFEPVLNKCIGGHSVILGIIDTSSRKYMPWSMEDLIHLSQAKLYLFPEDFSKADRDQRKIRNICSNGHECSRIDEEDWAKKVNDQTDDRIKSCRGCGKQVTEIME